MRLLRIVESIDDETATQAGFLSNDFSDDIKIEANQKIALLNATLSLKNTALTVDGENSKIEFQFTNATGARTAFMDSNIAYGTNGHQQGAQGVVNALNDALGCLLEDGNEPSEENPATGTGNGFNADISLQWEANTTGLTLLRWRRGTRSVDDDHWTNKSLTASPSVGAGGNYNNSTLEVDGSVSHPGGSFVSSEPFPLTDENGDMVLDEFGDPIMIFPDPPAEGSLTSGADPMGALYAKTPWAKGCCQHFCRIVDISPADDVESTYADVGISLGITNLAGSGASPKADIELSYGVKICWIDDGGGPAPPGIGYPVAVSAGEQYEPFGADLDINNARDIYWIEAGHAMNPVVGIFRNFGFFQTILYADAYFQFLCDNIGAPFPAPNGVAFPTDRAEAKTMYASAVPGTEDASLPGFPADIFGPQNAGQTVELVILNQQDNTNAAGAASPDLHPSFNFFSGPPAPGATAHGGIKVAFVRSTLDPWVAVPKPKNLKDPEDYLTLGANSPAPLSNLTTANNFLQLHQEVADYLGFYNKSMRAGFYRDPPSGFYSLLGQFSKNAIDPSDKSWYYQATVKTTNSSQFLNLQVIWKSRPLDCYDGNEGKQSSILATIPAQISSNGQIAYEAKNVNAINFRNPSAFSLRNAEVRILTADGNPVLFEGTQTLTLALLD